MKNARTSLALKSHLIAGGLAREARRDARPARDKAIKFNVKNCQNIYYCFFFTISFPFSFVLSHIFIMLLLLLLWGSPLSLLGQCQNDELVDSRGEWRA